MIDGHAYNFALGIAITGQRVMPILGVCRWWKLCKAEVMWPLWSSRHWAASPKGGDSMLFFSHQFRGTIMLVTSNSRSMLNGCIPRGVMPADGCDKGHVYTSSCSVSSVEANVCRYCFPDLQPLLSTAGVQPFVLMSPPIACLHEAA